MKIPAFIECRDFFIVGQFLTKLKGNPVSGIIFLGMGLRGKILLVQQYCLSSCPCHHPQRLS